MALAAAAVAAGLIIIASLGAGAAELGAAAAVDDAGVPDESLVRLPSSRSVAPQLTALLPMAAPTTNSAARPLRMSTLRGRCARMASLTSVAQNGQCESAT
jgi:hypothetical protein